MRDILSALWSVIGAKSSSCTGWMMPRVGLPNEISKTWPRIRQSLRQETDCRTCMKQAKICISLSLLYERNSKSIPLTSGIRCRILGKINPKLIGNVFWWVISKKCYKLADATLTRNWYKSDKETNFYCFKDCQCERKVHFFEAIFSTQMFDIFVWVLCRARECPPSVRVTDDDRDSGSDIKMPRLWWSVMVTPVTGHWTHWITFQIQYIQTKFLFAIEEAFVPK